MEQFLWSEKYRPRSVDECILPDHIKTTAKSFVAQGDLPNMIFSGGPGMGKTTLAMAMCRELGNVPLFINGSEESGIDIIRTKIKNFAAALSFDGKRRYIILDEADYLNQSSTQPALRALIEEFAINCGFIMTCNYGNRIIPALHSRCTEISFAIPTAEKRALQVKALTRMQEMLTKEHIVANEDLLVLVVKRFWPDLRRTISEIQLACVNGVLTQSVLGQHTDANFGDLWKAITSHDYTSARHWIGQHGDIDAAKFYRTVFDWLNEHAETACLPQLIITTADYQYKHLNAIDSHVHLAAYCLELMHHGRYQ